MISVGTEADVTGYQQLWEHFLQLSDSQDGGGGEGEMKKRKRRVRDKILRGKERWLDYIISCNSSVSSAIHYMHVLFIEPSCLLANFLFLFFTFLAFVGTPK